jgi:hypothetical protein
MRDLNLMICSMQLTCWTRCVTASSGPGTDDPSELRIDMLKLHGLAMAVVNNGAAPKTQAMFDLANDVQDEIASMREAIGKIEKTLNRLMDLYPESLAD